MSEVRRYVWGTLVIESRAAFPELRPSRARTAHVSFAIRRGAPRRRTYPWLHVWRLPDGSAGTSIARAGDEYVMRFARFADFFISGDRRTIRADVPASTRPNTIRHLLLDQVLPAIAGGGERVGLHASAVAIGGGAVVFAGPALRGKSTLAAAFGLGGHPVVTDDCLLIEPHAGGVRAIPTYPSLRLWQETVSRLAGGWRMARVAQYSDKLRVASAGDRGMRFRRRSLPVRRIYLLDKGRASLRIQPISARTGLSAALY